MSYEKVIATGSLYENVNDDGVRSIEHMKK